MKKAVMLLFSLAAFVAAAHAQSNQELLEAYRNGTLTQSQIDDLKAKGMEVYVVPEGELQKWRDATKSTWEQFVKETGKTGQELIDICIK